MVMQGSIPASKYEIICAQEIDPKKLQIYLMMII